jgi:hypothetical protein
MRCLRVIGIVIAVAAGGRERRSEAQDGTTNTTSAALSPPRPIAPLAGSFTRGAFKFRWEKSAPDVRVELSRTREFTTVDVVVAGASTGELEAPSDLEPGTWFWRLRSGAAGENEGDTTGVRSFVHQRSWKKCVEVRPGGTDLDGDGIPDLVTTTRLHGDTQVHVHFGKGVGGFDDVPDLTLFRPSDADETFGTSIAVVGDTDGDGYQDLVVTAPGKLIAYLYQGGPHMTDVVARRVELRPPDPVGVPLEMQVGQLGDENGDGYADFFIEAGRLVEPDAVYGAPRTHPFAITRRFNLSARLDTRRERDSFFYAKHVWAYGDVDGDGSDELLQSNLDGGVPRGVVIHHDYGYGDCRDSAQANDFISAPEGAAEFGGVFSQLGMSGGKLLWATQGQVDGKWRVYVYLGRERIAAMTAYRGEDVSWFGVGHDWWHRDRP